jgi:hypothetical protein
MEGMARWLKAPHESFSNSSECSSGDDESRYKEQAVLDDHGPTAR